MAAATFTYAGAGTCVAHVTGATVGHTYFFGCTDPDSTGDTVVASVASFDMTVTGIGGLSFGQTFSGSVFDNTLFGTIPASSVFAYGSAGQYKFDATFSYDGGPDPIGIVEVTFFAESGVNYEFDAEGEFIVQSATPIVGAGALTTMQITLAPGYEPVAGSQWLGTVWSPDGGLWAYYPVKTRLFSWGVAGVGALGNPLTTDDSVSFDIELHA